MLRPISRLRSKCHNPQCCIDRSLFRTDAIGLPWELRCENPNQTVLSFARILNFRTEVFLKWLPIVTTIYYR